MILFGASGLSVIGEFSSINGKKLGLFGIRLENLSFWAKQCKQFQFFPSDSCLHILIPFLP